MRRILIFSLFYYPHTIGGAEVAVKEITDRISSDEVVFDMITLGGVGESVQKIGNVNVHHILDNTRLSKFRYPWAAARKAAELHAVHHYDTVWAIMASYAGYAAKIFKKSHPKVPYLLTIQEGENFGRREFLRSFFKTIFRAADRISVISTYLEDWSINMGAKAPITVIPNAVDFDLFSRPVGDQLLSEVKNKLHKQDGDVFLITTGRLVPKNAIADIIRALDHLPQYVKLLVLGTGPDESMLKRLTKGDRVQFLGFVPHAKLPTYLQASDIFIRPSLSEGFGNSFIEAMAVGIPVIATPVGGITDFLKDGETGLLCEVNNPQSIAQKVEKLMKDQESKHYIVEQARKMVKERYGWDLIAEKMKAVL